jgi:hypothetical protein
MERSLLEQLRAAGTDVTSLSDVFDDFELVVAVPELNSLYFQTMDRLEGFARYYLFTRGHHLWTDAREGALLPHGAVFKVRLGSKPARRCDQGRAGALHLRPRSADAHRCDASLCTRAPSTDTRILPARERARRLPITKWAPSPSRAPAIVSRCAFAAGARARLTCCRSAAKAQPISRDRRSLAPARR